MVEALKALGNARPRLKLHINAVFNIGLSIKDIKEFLLQVTVFAGFPAAINGMNILKQVRDERKAK